MKFLAERPRLRSNLLAAFGLLLLLLLWLAPSGAFAAEVEWLDYGEIDYVAEEGEANDLAVEYSDGHYTFTEAGDGVPSTDGDALHAWAPQSSPGFRLIGGY